MSTPSPKSKNVRMSELTVATRDRNQQQCTAHTRNPWNSRHKHGWWPPGSRGWAMWCLVAVVAGVLVTALVFAVDAGLRSAGVMSYAARGGPAGYGEVGGPVEKEVNVGEIG